MTKLSPFQPGEDPLAVRYMTPEERDEIVCRVRQTESATARRSAIARWNRAARQLTSAQVVGMREARAAGAKLAALAQQYGVSEPTVQRIVTGQRYRDVGGPRTGRDLQTR